MLEVERKPRKDFNFERPKKRDIIIKKAKEKITYENGKKVIETVYEKTNLTKKINETAKLVKSDNAILLQKMDEVEKIFTEIKGKK